MYRSATSLWYKVSDPTQPPPYPQSHPLRAPAIFNLHQGGLKHLEQWAEWMGVFGEHDRSEQLSKCSQSQGVNFIPLWAARDVNYTSPTEELTPAHTHPPTVSFPYTKCPQPSCTLQVKAGLLV